MRCFHSGLLAVFIISGWALGGQVIDFEMPGYTVGSGLPSPWLVGDGADVGITNTVPIAGFQSLSLGYTPGSYGVRYPIAAPADDTFSLSVSIRLAAYNPGSYEMGFGSLGVVAPTDWPGAVWFQMEKPYTVPAAASHRQIWFKQPSNVVGYFVNGGTYAITYTINWTQKTSVVRIVGDGGVDLTLTNQDSRISKSSLAGLNLWGRTFSHISTRTLFDTIVIGEPQMPIIGDFDASGTVDLYDFALLARSWGSLIGDGDWNATCNLDDSGDSKDTIDIADLAVFCEMWLSSI